MKRREEKFILKKGGPRNKKYNNNIYGYFEDKIIIKKDINIKERNNKIKINNRFIIIYIIINLIILSNNNKYSNITLKIKGNGYNNIFTTGTICSDGFKSSNYPNEIYINGKKQNNINYYYYFNDTDNYIELIWNNSINNCGCMFLDCINITEINLSHFNTSQVTYMYSMFYNCISLTSLDLSHFNTSQVTDMRIMFYNCTNLEYINLNNFIGIKLSGSDYYSNMFDYIPDNAVICIKDNKDNKIIVNQIKNKKCYIIDCDNDWKLKQKKLINNNNICIDNCYNDTIYKYEYNGKCYNNCINGYINNTICKCELEKCLICSNVAIYYNLCNKCNYNYYPKENDINNIGEYINCYNNIIDEYYLDKNESIYKKCYNSCKTCEINGNNILHNCLTCKNNYNISEIKNNYYNCYNNCNYYYYIDNEYNYHCTNNYSCPNEYKLIINKNKCIKNCNDDDIYKYEYNNTCYENNSIKEINTNSNFIDEIITNNIFINNTNILINTDINEIICTEEQPFEIIEKKQCIKNCDINDIIEEKCILKYKKNKTEIDNNIKEEDIFLSNIELGFTSESFNTSDLDNGKEKIIRNNNITITLTNSENQKNNNNNMTSIDLGECEIELRKYYNISNDKKLYIKKIDVEQFGFQIPKVEYDIYSKLNDSNLIKLDKLVCSNVKINIDVPIKLTESLDILNSSSGYYNDICYSATSDSGTDISLKDRKDNYINGNKAVCQDDCDFSEYFYDIQKAQCSCEVKESSTSFNDMIIDKKNLYKNFIKVKNIANMKILACYEKLFTKEAIVHNIGCFVIIPISIIHIITIIIFYIKHINELRNIISDLRNKIKNIDSIKSKKSKKSKNKNKKKTENNIISGINIDNIKDNKKKKNKKNNRKKTILLKINEKK